MNPLSIIQLLWFSKLTQKTSNVNIVLERTEQQSFIRDDSKDTETVEGGDATKMKS